jgi:hypothetical protein
VLARSCVADIAELFDQHAVAVDEENGPRLGYVLGSDVRPQSKPVDERLRHSYQPQVNTGGGALHGDSSGTILTRCNWVCSANQRLQLHQSAVASFKLYGELIRTQLKLILEQTKRA